MLRRLPLILCFTLFATCISAWVFSHFRTLDAYYTGGRKSVGIALHNPAVLLYIQEVITSPRGSPFTSPFTLQQFDKRMGDSWDSTLFPRRFLGFSYNADVNALRIPLYLPTLASALLTLWLWRRHRRDTIAKGFEVQPSP